MSWMMMDFAFAQGCHGGTSAFAQGSWLMQRGWSERRRRGRRLRRPC
uniref:Uncharacterized protein n=1 Tax=Arundo donax TaxID=35708 RepID=A0A0A9DZR6_ARUDO